MLNHYHKRTARTAGEEHGFTLIELLVAIVVVAILAAVAIVGISGLTNKGQQSACKTTQDAAKAAAAVDYANNSDTTPTYPTTFTAMIDAHELDLSSDVTPTDNVLTGKGWTLTMAGGGTTAPTFTCAVS